MTTGGQMVLSAQDLRAEGAVVEHAVCVIDREGGGADVDGSGRDHPPRPLHHARPRGRGTRRHTGVTAPAPPVVPERF